MVGRRIQYLLRDKWENIGPLSASGTILDTVIVPMRRVIDGGDQWVSASYYLVKRMSNEQEIETVMPSQIIKILS